MKFWRLHSVLGCSRPSSIWFIQCTAARGLSFQIPMLFKPSVWLVSISFLMLFKLFNELTQVHSGIKSDTDADWMIFFFSSFPFSWRSIVFWFTLVDFEKMEYSVLSYFSLSFEKLQNVQIVARAIFNFLFARIGNFSVVQITKSSAKRVFRRWEGVADRVWRWGIVCNWELSPEAVFLQV